MDIHQAIISHYQEVCPSVETRDSMLFFVKEGVIVLLADDNVVILSDFRRPDVFDTLIKSGLARPPKTTMDKMNQKRAWQYLVKHSRCRYLDYCDPRLFDIIDEALHVPPVPLP